MSPIESAVLISTEFEAPGRGARPTHFAVPSGVGRVPLPGGKVPDSK
jgi:hypothetical protein